MNINHLDHVNIRTSDLQSLTTFYTEVLQLRLGPRPEFPFPGAWLYCGDRAVVHLVAVSEPPDIQGTLSLEHFAFTAEGLGEFLAHLRDLGVSYRVAVVPGIGVRQVRFNDPEGNHLHVDFSPEEEAADLGPYDP